MLDHALFLASLGFHIFPAHPNSKVAAIKDFPNLATQDSKQIKKWWSNGHTNSNPAISTTRFKESEALIVIDIDQKEGKMGEDELLKLELQGFDFPATLEQRTPSGGRHLIYKTKESVKQGVNVLAKGLDIRSRGGYIIGAGSVLSNGKYVLINGEIAEAPQWLVSRLYRPPAKPNSGPTPGAYRVNEENAYERARHYLEVEASPSLKGAGGDQTCFTVAARVKDFGVKREDCLNLMLESNWWERSGSSWTPEKLQIKINNAYKYGEHAQGIASPEAVFKKIEEPKPKNQLFKENLSSINPDFNQLFLVDKYLQPNGMTVVYGPSGSGKTFFVVNLALHIALGREWNGKPVTPGLVIYIAAEGAWGIKKRIKAFKDYHKIHDGPFALIPCPINLLDPKKHVKELLEIVKNCEKEFGQKAAMIVVDTLARAMGGGNENSVEDMGAFVETIDFLRKSTKAHLLIIHHSGKDIAKGARGHSSLKAATDTEIEINKLTATMMKQRDMDMAAPIEFKLEVITIGHEPSGAPVHSCVVVPSNASAVKDFSQAQLDPSTLAGKGHKALLNALDWNPQPAPDDLELGEEALVVSLDDWREQFYQLAYPGKEKQKSWNVAFTRMVNSLSISKHAKTKDIWAWI